MCEITHVQYQLCSTTFALHRTSSEGVKYESAVLFSIWTPVSSYQKQSMTVVENPQFLLLADNASCCIELNMQGEDPIDNIHNQTVRS